MTLATHGAVGAAIASIMPTHPILAFAAAFLSHFILDSIPHWDYKILSLKKNKNNRMDVDMKIGKDFFIDLIRIGSDILIGMIVGLLMFRDSVSFPYVLIIGVAGAITPDFLQFLYFKIKKQPLTSLQSFHIFINEKIFIKGNKYLKDKPVLGIVCQLCTFFIVYGIVSLISV
jgi:hypothetical protein